MQGEIHNPVCSLSACISSLHAADQAACSLNHMPASHIHNKSIALLPPPLKLRFGRWVIYEFTSGAMFFICTPLSGREEQKRRLHLNSDWGVYN